MHVEYIKKMTKAYSELGYPGYNWVHNEDTPPWQCTFMGGIYSAGKVKERLAPAITEQLLKHAVDTLLLVPV